jgi:hypothetical protein
VVDPIFDLETWRARHASTVPTSRHPRGPVARLVTLSARPRSTSQRATTGVRPGTCLEEPGTDLQVVQRGSG